MPVNRGIDNVLMQQRLVADARASAGSARRRPIAASTVQDSSRAADVGQTRGRVEPRATLFGGAAPSVGKTPPPPTVLAPSDDPGARDRAAAAGSGARA